MYIITLVCKGIPPNSGAEAARDIAEEFTHRPWHSNLKCEWNSSELTLCAENDYDSDGRALSDDFSDAVSACVAAEFGYSIEVLSVKEI